MKFAESMVNSRHACKNKHAYTIDNAEIILGIMLYAFRIL